MKLVECKSATSPSRLPGLDRALNPYRGCAHSCAYCYAQDVTRFDMGGDWGELVEVKVNIVQRLKKELEKGSTGVYGVGTVTDPYQPLESKYELTRGCLSLLRRSRAKASVLTKSDLVLRDLDVLKGWEGVEVGVSIATVDSSRSKMVERSAPAPQKRFDALKRLSDEGVKVYLMAAPLIRGVSDSDDDLRELVASAKASGVVTIMWDRFNSKPLAMSRMRTVFSENGLPSPELHSKAEIARIRALLDSECNSAGIRLLDAF